jgi:hypothetical protein
LSETGFYNEDTDDDFWGQLGHEDATPTEAPEEPEAVTVDAPEAGFEIGQADPEPEAEVEEPVAEGRARNADGTFAAKEQPEPQEEADASQLQAQIQALEKRLADKDDFAGRLSNELGELRKLQEQALEHAQRPAVSDWDNLIDENPAQAARIAIERGDQFRYQQARQAWEDLAPGAPDLFEQNMRMQQQVAQLEKRFTETTEPMQRTQATQQVASAYVQIKEKYPDFDKLEDAIAEVVETRPLIKRNLTEALNGGSLEEQVAVLEDLYLITAGRRSDTLRGAQTQAAQSTAAEALAAKQDAIVVSATSNATEPAEPKTWWDVAEADEKFRADGWNIS